MGFGRGGKTPFRANRKNVWSKDCEGREEALKWGKGIVMEEEEEEEDGIFLVWEGDSNGGGGSARLYIPPDDDRDKGSDETVDITFSTDDATTKVFLWTDDDAEARKLNHRRVTLGQEISVTELDRLIEKRKGVRMGDSGFECWDDWMLRAVSRTEEGGVDVGIVMEAAVPAAEVELHYSSTAAARGKTYEYPLGHESVRRTECDSDEDVEDEDDPDDGTGAALDYFRRRLEQNGCDVRRVDPRGLGDCDDDDDGVEGGGGADPASAAAFRSLITKPLPGDAESEYLEANGVECPSGGGGVDGDDDGGDDEKSNLESEALPSWEGYFGAASELLYYSPHVKADYTPFLCQLLKNPAATDKFFRALYFGTVEEATDILDLGTDDEERFSLTCTRSLLYCDGEKNIYKRPDEHNRLVPVRYAPMHCYLKARGSDPPQTWISALQSNLRSVTDGQAKFLLEEVRKWYERSVRYLLQDPKNCDGNGDYFAAYLRAVRRDIYDDVDRSDPEVLRRRDTVPSLSYSSKGKGRNKKKTKKHVLRDIEIPDAAAVFEGWRSGYDPKKPRPAATAARDRVLSQIVVDAYQLRMVDVAAIVGVADRVAAAKSSKVVVVVYAGGEHADTVCDFFKDTMGFSNLGLKGKGLVGKVEGWDDDRSRALTYPDYLHDFDLLFPVPVSSAGITSKKKKKKKKRNG